MTTTQPILLGTAGHIDHGKTELVKALTGIDTDRLKVEKERGITTELGFAHLDLGDRRFGFIDVPGHERFIKAMVSGAGGLDLVCLVIAADEGVMPQTREHLDICQLLGVSRGVVALTKSDLVDAEWVALVSEEVRSYLQGSFLADAAIVPVSARTGAGLDALRAEIGALAGAIAARSPDGPFRMPLDRVFTIKGFGTVVTGTVWGGRVATGDAVAVLPAELEARVRGTQVHGDDAPAAPAGVRAALNLTGVDREQLRRGDWLAHPGALQPSHLVDVSFQYLRSSRAPLPRRSRVLLHHGTTQLLATLVLADRDQLQPGERSLGQLRVDATTPLCALPGDRFIARGFTVQEHYGTTLGGGEILRIHAPKVKRATGADAIAAIAAAAGAARVALEIKTAEVAGMARDVVASRMGLSPAETERVVRELLESGEIVAFDGSVVHAEPFARLDKLAVDLVDSFHKDNPTREGMPREELRARLPAAMPPRLFDTVVDAAVRRGALAADKDVVRRVKRSAQRSPLAATLAQRFADWALTPARPADLPGELNAPAAQVKQALDQLVKDGSLIRVRPDLFVDARAIEALKARLLAHLEQHGEITAQQWKELTGTSRKFSIPLAEYFDAQKVTLRVGEIRKRRGG